MEENLEKILIVSILGYLVYIATQKKAGTSFNNGGGSTYPDFDPTKDYVPKSGGEIVKSPPKGDGSTTHGSSGSSGGSNIRVGGSCSIGSPNFKPKNNYCGCKK